MQAWRLASLGKGIGFHGRNFVPGRLLRNFMKANLEPLPFGLILYGVRKPKAESDPVSLPASKIERRLTHSESLFPSHSH